MYYPSQGCLSVTKLLRLGNKRLTFEESVDYVPTECTGSAHFSFCNICAFSRFFFFFFKLLKQVCGGCLKGDYCQFTGKMVGTLWTMHLFDEVCGRILGLIYTFWRFFWTKSHNVNWRLASNFQNKLDISIEKTLIIFRFVAYAHWSLRLNF